MDIKPYYSEKVLYQANDGRYCMYRIPGLLALGDGGVREEPGMMRILADIISYCGEALIMAIVGVIFRFL